MGPVAEVTALYSTQTHQIEVEDAALAVLRFSSGAMGEGRPPAVTGEDGRAALELVCAVYECSS